jgi:predicted metalloprotease with PDZ domain
MSKQNRIIFLGALVFFETFLFSVFSQAQIIDAKIKIDALLPEIISVEGTNLDANPARRGKNFSFALSYAGVENLGERVSDVRLFDEKKREILYKKLVAGEYLAEREFAAWSYKIKPQSAESVSKAHVSSLSGEQAILMLGDLLPQFDAKESEKKTARISLELPAEWKISSTEKRSGENAFAVADLEKAVFYIGKNWREKELKVGNGQLKFIISGARQFSDDESFQMADEIFGFYQKLFGSSPNEKAQIYLGTLGDNAKFGRWAAETRGANITIFSAEMPFKTQSVQRLHEQLRHEIFHLWMPNNLNLSGNYDWFYEGFALYQSLRTGVAVNRLRFEDFLDTLARAHSIDTLQTQRVSLVEASKNRWNGANTQIYARGMLVAFLCDIAVLDKSKGKNSLSDILRQIYQKHSYPNARSEGNTAVLSVLRERAELRPIVEKYVDGTENIVWKTDLGAVGIESAEENFQTKLKVTAKPNGRQKELLNELGYNNWRKLSEISK